MFNFDKFSELKNQIRESLKKKVSDGGDCYQANAKWITSNFKDAKKWQLVHGYVISTTQDRVRYDHCWLEKDNLVKDLSNGREIEIDKRIYYAVGNIETKTLIKYSQNEVFDKLDKYGHWGPWDLK